MPVRRSKASVGQVRIGPFLAIAGAAGAGTFGVALGLTSLQASLTTSPDESTVNVAPATTPTEGVNAVDEVVAIPYQRETVADAATPAGVTRVRTAGVAGSKTVLWRVTVEAGVVTSRSLVREEVIRPPVDEVVEVGTRPAS